MKRCCHFCFGTLFLLCSGCAAWPGHHAAPPAQADCLPAPDAAVSPDVISEIQARLILLGYGAGPVDGVLGDRTRNAIRSYQADHGLLTDGLATPELALHLKGAASRADGPPAAP